MEISNQELSTIIGKSKTTIRILGVIALNPDWSNIIKKLSTRIESDNEFLIHILCESDNTIFAKSLTSDSEHSKSRVSFKDLQFIRRRTIVDLPGILKKSKNIQ